MVARRIYKALVGAAAGRHYRGECPNCGQWVSRRSGDRFTKCHRCGWKAGLPGLRILTHWPNWYHWKRWTRRWTWRTAKLSVIVGVVMLVIGATIGTGIAPIDSTADGVVGWISDGQHAGNRTYTERPTRTDNTNLHLLPSDTDNDTLHDKWERQEKVRKATLSGSHPRHKDLYIVIVYSGEVSPLTKSEKQDLKNIWAKMDVSNPDGESGVDLHIVEELRISDSKVLPAEMGKDAREEKMTGWYRKYVDHGCGKYHLVLFGHVRGEAAGYGDAPGYTTIVDGYERRSFGGHSVRVGTITHELLHNIVGEIDGSHAPGDPMHAQTGWLAAKHDYNEAETYDHLSEPVASQLSHEGFAESDYYQMEVC